MMMMIANDVDVDIITKVEIIVIFFIFIVPYDFCDHGKRPGEESYFPEISHHTHNITTPTSPC